MKDVRSILIWNVLLENKEHSCHHNRDIYHDRDTCMAGISIIPWQVYLSVPCRNAIAHSLSFPFSHPIELSESRSFCNFLCCFGFVWSLSSSSSFSSFFLSFSFLLSFALVMFIWLHFRCHNCLHWPPQHIHAEQVRTGLLLAFMPASFEWGLVAWWIKELVNQGESGWFDAWWSHGSLLYWFDGMYLSYTTDNFKMKTIYM